MTNVASTVPPPASLDPRLIIPLIKSIQATFSKMIRLEVTIDRPHVKSSPAPNYDVSGIIGISGDFLGSIVVSFEMQAATKIVTAFVGIALPPDSPKFPDAIGELANMIAGGAKKDFGGKTTISVPNVIIGSGHQVARLSDVPCLVIPCRTPAGNFAVEVSLKHVRAQMG